MNLSELTDRYDLINNILRKHKLLSSSEIFSKSESIKLEIDIYENYENEKKSIVNKINELHKLLEEKSDMLSLPKPKSKSLL